MRVYAVSDLHVDYPENLEWIQSLGETSHQGDVLILAGDVSHQLDALRQVFESLRSKFMDVFFVPGNHDLWIDEDELDCSLEKFHTIEALCKELGILRDVHHYGELSIVPLLGWYDFSFGEPDRHLRRAWRDFRSCQWPVHLDNAAALNDFFLNKNESLLSTSNTTVISFSHFLPGIDVMPTRIPVQCRRIYPILGSDALGEQVRKLNPDIHVYGHSHVNQSIELDNIRFVNNALAYPSENHIARRQLDCVWEVAELEYAAAR